MPNPSQFKMLHDKFVFMLSIVVDILPLFYLISFTYQFLSCFMFVNEVRITVGRIN